MLYILLPAYNEAACINTLLDKIGAAFADTTPPPRIMVVDDGSSDGTADIVRAHALAAGGQAEVITHEKNSGLGAAMRTGIYAFLDRSAPGDILAALDADDTHNPEVIKDLLREIAGGADIVTASRFQPGGQEIGVSLPRRVISRGARLFMTLAAPVPGVRDYTCGFRAYTREILEKGKTIYGENLVESNTFSVMSELLVKLAAAGAVIKEVPFTLRYDLKQGPSKIKFSETLMGYMTLFSMGRRAKRMAAQRNNPAAKPK